MKWWLLGCAATATAFAVAYWIEDPFLKRHDPWADYDRLLRMRTEYGWQGTQRWS